MIKLPWTFITSAACRTIESSTHAVLSLIIGLVFVQQLLGRHIFNLLVWCSDLRRSTIVLISTIEELTVI
jgi:hypothetical protein